MRVGYPKCLQQTIKTNAILEHPPYSPDLAPLDFFLFDLLKKHLGGTHFQNEEVMNAVTEYFDGKCVAYFRDSIFKLLHCWEKCINLNGDYVKKWKNM